MSCVLCEIHGADVDALLFPTRADVLFTMAHVHLGEWEGWPSLELCETCAAITAPVFAVLAEHLSAAALASLTSADLLVICRLALDRQDAG